MQAHSSGAGQLKCQLSAMGMLLRAIVSLRLSRPHHGDVLFKARLRAGKRAEKEAELKQGSPSCLEAAWKWTNRCEQLGLDGDIVEKDGACTFTPSSEVCAAKATGVIDWATGPDACKDYDVGEYPPKASLRCLYDARRKPLSASAAAAAATAAFAPVPGSAAATQGPSTPAAATPDPPAATPDPPAATPDPPAATPDPPAATPDPPAGTAMDGGMLDAPEITFAALPDEYSGDDMYSRTAQEEDQADPACTAGEEEMLQEELADVERQVMAELDALEAEIADGGEESVMGMAIDDLDL
jgi:hypothetical protein